MVTFKISVLKHCVSICSNLTSPLATMSTMATSSTPSAEQPTQTTHLALSELNKASVKTGGTWLVDAYGDYEDKYE